MAFVSLDSKSGLGRGEAGEEGFPCVSVKIASDIIPQAMTEVWVMFNFAEYVIGMT
jgi:hypothetical protein